MSGVSNQVLTLALDSALCGQPRSIGLSEFKQLANDDSEFLFAISRNNWLPNHVEILAERAGVDSLGFLYRPGGHMLPADALQDGLRQLAFLLEQLQSQPENLLRELNLGETESIGPLLSVVSGSLDNAIEAYNSHQDVDEGRGLGVLVTFLVASEKLLLCASERDSAVVSFVHIYGAAS